MQFDTRINNLRLDLNLDRSDIKALHNSDLVTGRIGVSREVWALVQDMNSRIKELTEVLEAIQRRNYPPNFAGPYPAVLDSYAIATQVLDECAESVNWHTLKESGWSYESWETDGGVIGTCYRHKFDDFAAHSFEEAVAICKNNYNKKDK